MNSINATDLSTSRGTDLRQRSAREAGKVGIST